jgi:hypothetical protein
MRREMPRIQRFRKRFKTTKYTKYTKIHFRVFRGLGIWLRPSGCAASQQLKAAAIPSRVSRGNAAFIACFSSV